MHPEVVAANWQLIASGIALTIQIAFVAILIGMVLGLLIAVARVSGPRPLALLATWLCRSDAQHAGPGAVPADFSRSRRISTPYRGGTGGDDRARLQQRGVPVGNHSAAAFSQYTRVNWKPPPRSDWRRRSPFPRSSSLRRSERSIRRMGNQFIQVVLASSIGTVIGAPELTQQINFIDSRTFRTVELLLFLTSPMPFSRCCCPGSCASSARGSSGRTASWSRAVRLSRQLQPASLLRRCCSRSRCPRPA